MSAERKMQEELRRTEDGDEQAKRKFHPQTGLLFHEVLMGVNVKMFTTADIFFSVSYIYML